MQRIVRNARYVLLPWVTVPHLASHALGLVARQVAEDWQRQHGYRPVLLETYVVPETKPPKISSPLAKRAAW